MATVVAQYPEDSGSASRGLSLGPAEPSGLHIFIAGVLGRVTLLFCAPVTPFATPPPLLFISEDSEDRSEGMHLFSVRSLLLGPWRPRQLLRRGHAPWKSKATSKGGVTSGGSEPHAHLPVTRCSWLLNRRCESTSLLKTSAYFRSIWDDDCGGNAVPLGTPRRQLQATKPMSPSRLAPAACKGCACLCPPAVPRGAGAAVSGVLQGGRTGSK